MEASFDMNQDKKHSKVLSNQLPAIFENVRRHQTTLSYNPRLLPEHVWMFEVATEQIFIARPHLNVQCQSEVN